jgi:hypothetical protein
MKRSGWRRPSPAVAIACLALFVALGGTVLAATKIDGRAIKVKSLPGNRLAVGSLPGNRLRPGTIPGNRIAPHSLGGDRVDVGGLGQVPSAAHADSADVARHADTATAAEHAADATTINGRAVGCAAGRREFAGACWDLQPSMAATNAVEAAAACGAAGGELPETLTLLAFGRQPGVKLDLAGEWTKQVGKIGEAAEFPVVFVAPSGVFSEQWTDRHRFRCVTPLLG